MACAARNGCIVSPVPDAADAADAADAKYAKYAQDAADATDAADAQDAKYAHDVSPRLLWWCGWMGGWVGGWCKVGCGGGGVVETGTGAEGMVGMHRGRIECMWGGGIARDRAGWDPTFSDSMD